jgi:hypothetical protein
MNGFLPRRHEGNLDGFWFSEPVWLPLVFKVAYWGCGTDGSLRFPSCLRGELPYGQKKGRKRTDAPRVRRCAFAVQELASQSLTMDEMWGCGAPARTPRGAGGCGWGWLPERVGGGALYRGPRAGILRVFQVPEGFGPPTPPGPKGSNGTWSPSSLR